MFLAVARDSVDARGNAGIGTVAESRKTNLSLLTMKNLIFTLKTECFQCCFQMYAGKAKQ